MKILSLKNSTLESVLRTIKARQSKKADVEETVSDILARVRAEKDAALFALTKQFDGADLKTLAVSKQEVAAAYKEESKEFVAALRVAKANIEKFHTAMLKKKERAVTTTKGVKVWREFRPIERVGLYIPGGKAAYPSTVLMLAIPATIAGCKEIVLCVPPGKDGKVPSAVLVAADMCGVSRICKVGGAQAIGAMAYGTESIPKVSKIFGPGNAYVTAAKMLVFGEVAIDMPAGPSEVLVVADDTANPAWIAADLLSQLEHGEDSQAVLVAFSDAFAQQVEKEMVRQTKELPRRQIIEKSLQNSAAVIVENVTQACELVNEYAPEHLEIVSAKESEILSRINNAGSVFLGQYSSEPLGDYATGSNHTLPTSGYAKMFPPLSVESFGKMVQIQKVSKAGLQNLKDTVEVLAAREGLDAHKNAVSIRFKKII